MSAPNITTIQSALLCPNCGGEYLHHKYVDVWSRVEDEPSVQCVSVNGSVGDVPRTIEPSDNCPSLRRGAVSVRFWCEGCDAESVLEIIQHKGQTFINMNPVRG